MKFSPAERLRDPAAPPVENIAIRRAVLRPEGIVLTVFNESPEAVTIAQVTVDDAYWQFAAEPGQTVGALRSATLTDPLSVGGRRGAHHPRHVVHRHEVRARDPGRPRDAAGPAPASC